MYDELIDELEQQLRKDEAAAVTVGQYSPSQVGGG